MELEYMVVDAEQYLAYYPQSCLLLMLYDQSLFLKKGQFCWILLFFLCYPVDIV